MHGSGPHARSLASAIIVPIIATGLTWYQSKREKTEGAAGTENSQLNGGAGKPQFLKKYLDGLGTRKVPE